MRLTSAQLATLRKRPHRTRLWFSIYPPPVVFSAQVTGSYALGDTQITLHNFSGSYLNNYPNMTVLVGSSRGEGDIARIRMRSATGTYAVMAENAILWQAGQYLTFIDYITIDSVYPKIIQDPNNDENVIFYKDSDIAYSNQNSIFGSFPNAGSHRAAFLETGTVSIYYTATGTVNVADSGLTYSWFFEGGTPTGSTSFEPGYVSYNSTGHRKTRLTVTAANGGVDTTYRYVSIYNRPEEGSFNPIRKWNLNSLSGSRAEGGYVANVRVWDELGDIEPNALVVLFADDWYGDEYTSLGGQKNNSKIVFVGYILKDSIQFNYREGWAEFDIGTVSEVMKQSEAFSVSCESVPSPSTWFQLREMTVQKALYHYLRWHSTVLNVTDFQYVGDDRLVQYFDADRSSLYDAVNSFVEEGLIGAAVSDRQGKLWTEITDVGLFNPFTSLRQNFTFNKHDWINEPQISVRRVADTSFVEMGGIVYNGVATNTFQALLSNAPSVAPLYRGKTDGSKQGLILTSQKQLNQIAGNYLAVKNHSVESVNLSIAGNYRHLDLAPMERQFLLIDENDAPNALSLTGKQFKLTSMDWFYDAKNESFYPDAVLEPITTGTSAQTIIIPPTPDLPGYEYPDFELPPLPGFPVSPPTSPQFATTAFVRDASEGWLYTLDLDADRPEWAIFNAGIDPSYKTETSTLFITPNGSVWAYFTLFGSVGYRALYYAPSVGSVFSLIIDSAWVDSQIGGGSDANIAGAWYNPNKPEEIGVMIQNNGGAAAFAIGDHNGFAVTSTSLQDGDASLGKVFFHKDMWFAHVGDFSTSVRLNRLRADGTFIDFAAVVTPARELWNPTDDTDTLYGIPNGSPLFQRSIDLGKTWTTNNVGQNLNWIDREVHRDFVTADGGRNLMHNFGTVNAGKSSDFGYTFSQITNLPVQSSWKFVPMRSPTRWMAVGNSVIYTTDDFGGSWKRKDTWIPEFLIPFPSFRGGMVRLTA
jgi:hypothetical protein